MASAHISPSEPSGEIDRSRPSNEITISADQGDEDDEDEPERFGDPVMIPTTEVVDETPRRR